MLLPRIYKLDGHLINMNATLQLKKMSHCPLMWWCRFEIFRLAICDDYNEVDCSTVVATSSSFWSWVWFLLKNNSPRIWGTELYSDAYDFLVFKKFEILPGRMIWLMHEKHVELLPRRNMHFGRGGRQFPSRPKLSQKNGWFVDAALCLFSANPIRLNRHFRIY